MSKRIGLITFVRNPELGKVKTRIAKTAGDEKALAIYKALLQHTRKVVTEVDCSRYLFYSQAVKTDDEWATTDFIKLVQSGGDLGHKMLSAFEHVLSECDKAIIIGSDCASLSSDHLRQAIAALETHDVVIGPTYDGGYYLLGMNTLRPTLFQDMPWSTDVVFEKTISKLSVDGLAFQTLEMLSDIDHEADWDKWGWEL